jgi:hypothetical protein
MPNSTLENKNANYPEMTYDYAEIILIKGISQFGIVEKFLLFVYGISLIVLLG